MLRVRQCRRENGSQQEGRGVGGRRSCRYNVLPTDSRGRVEGEEGGAWAEERGSGGVAVLCQWKRGVEAVDSVRWDRGDG